MTAVFALRSDFNNLVQRVDNPRQYRLVTDNIQVEFCSLNITNIIFLGDFHKAYPNLLRIATLVRTYIRGPHCEAALHVINTLIEIELQVEKFHKTLLNSKIFNNENSQSFQVHQC